MPDAAPPFDIADRARRLLGLALGDRDDELRLALFASVTAWPPSADVADRSPAESSPHTYRDRETRDLAGALPSVRTSAPETVAASP
ncbi:MAG: hypothetical protein NVS9B8_14860 [Candidatus Limnocylindrales bacterium]